MKKFQFVFLMFGVALLCPRLSAQGDHNPLQLRVDPAYFSPNDDGLQDQTFFYPVLNENAEVTRWTLDVLSARHRKRVVRMSGPAFPALIKWDGLDSKGQPAPDGAYVAQFTAFGRKNLTAEQTCVIDRLPPDVSLALSSAVFDRSMIGAGASLIIQPRVPDSSVIDRWVVQVVDMSGRDAFVYWSSGSVANIGWDGTDHKTGVLVPQGAYRVVFQAWDKAGNESRPVFANLQVNVTAREMLERAIHKIRVDETPLGLIVQIDARTAFELVNNKQVLTDEGNALLREVGILLNAYPEADVSIDGYAQVKNPSYDRSRSSIYAWQVYSYLTKTANVKASRLTVGGHGRTVEPERRSLRLPVLKNGVEVIVRGNRRW